MQEIEDFPGYFLLENGSIHNRKGMTLKPMDNARGYLQVGLYNKGKRHMKYVHRLVATHFLPNTENKPCINHKNGNKKDNRATNLEWCTYSENNKHTYETGLASNKGNNNPRAKFTDEQIAEIRKLQGRHEDIAKDFGVHQTTISKIKRGATWKSIKK